MGEILMLGWQALSHSWVFWGACALGFSLGIGLLGWHVKKLPKQPNKKPPQNIMGTSPQLIRNTIPRRVTDRAKELPWISLFGVGILCFGLGWGSRDLTQLFRTHTLHDVRITQKQDDANYHMTFMDQPADEFRAPLCTGRPFFVGLQFKVFTYENRGDCWFIEWTDNTKLGYRFYDTLYKEKQYAQAR